MTCILDSRLEPLGKPFQLDVVSVSGIPLQEGKRLNTAQMELVRKKVKIIMSTAHSKGCRQVDEKHKVAKNSNSTVVLGALGCGNYNNDPKLISTIFHYVLVDENYASFFKNVTFAITGNEENYVVFREAFNTK